MRRHVPGGARPLGARHHTTTWTWDGELPRGWRDEEPNPRGAPWVRTEAYEHDAQGRLVRTTHTEPDGTVTVTTHAYDAQGHRVKDTERAPNGSERVTTYAYDAQGRLVTTTEPASTTVQEWDAQGRLARIGGYEVSWSEDGRIERRLKSDTLDSGVTRVYDAHGNLLTERRVLGRNLDEIRYDYACWTPR